jgi:hypothetical protein
MHVTPDTHLEFLRTHIIARTDVYARQQKDGRYHKVAKELTDSALIRHLEHIITIGCYTSFPDSTCKFALFDVDGHEGEETIPLDVVRGRASKLILTLKSFDIPYTFAESSPGCYHIHIFFDPPAKTAEAYDFIRWAARNAELPETEMFPKQREIPEGDYGNLVRLGFSLHQKKGTEYRYINDEFEYVDEFEVTPIDISGFVTKDTYQPPATVENENGEPMPPMRTTAARGGVPPCLQTCLENNVQMTGGGGHFLRIACVCAYGDAGLSHAAICRLFTLQRDYDEDYTARQVHSVLKKPGGYSYSCKTLREKCAKFVLPYCSSCPCGRRFK